MPEFDDVNARDGRGGLGLEAAPGRPRIREVVDDLDGGQLVLVQDVALLVGLYVGAGWQQQALRVKLHPLLGLAPARPARVVPAADVSGVRRARHHPLGRAPALRLAEDVHRQLALRRHRLQVLRAVLVALLALGQVRGGDGLPGGEGGEGGRGQGGALHRPHRPRSPAALLEALRGRAKGVTSPRPRLLSRTAPRSHCCRRCRYTYACRALMAGALAALSIAVGANAGAVSGVA